ncbi:hypothetical protein [Roseivivax isoporae]|uniref:Sulfatase n=1 Tax=Roseivivax isoporae LMG 25204 TaxID=1449351 RepID=X7FA02_9RHOB|nr:hypothetical protein [Roseivivax isoporae]ETX28924.1 sulfatase [Roseivivax isoporae LMG 25204]
MTGRTIARRGIALALAALVLDLLLILPNHPGAMTPGALRLIPLELPAILLGFLALGPGRAGRILRVLVVGALVVLVTLKVADLVTQVALSRSFNPVADWPLIPAGLNVLAGSLGTLAAVGAAVAGIAAVVALTGLATWTTGVWMRSGAARPVRPVLGAAALAAAGVAVGEVGEARGLWRLPAEPPGAAFTARTGVEKVALGRRTVAAMRDFAVQARDDAVAGREGLLDAIDTDLLVIFVESYGRASLDGATYAPTHRATLGRAEEALDAAGLASRSGLLVAPTSGGQSWLSHTTLATGLWVPDQMRHVAALRTGRRTLWQIAGGAGFRSLAVMPGITMPWPEARALGFEETRVAASLGYRGEPFDWVTMPDQYTLRQLEHILDGADRAPVAAQVALISSHAPWTPIAEPVDWQAVGDGSIFDGSRRAGDAPAVVWRDRDRVREQYRLALDYALSTVFEFAARRGEAARPPLILILGDHQAAGWIAEDTRPHVPAHLIGSPDLVARASDWGWEAGLLPGPAVDPLPMDRMRDLILRTFSSPDRLADARAAGADAAAAPRKGPTE